MPRQNHRPTARDIAVARSLRSLFEHSIPKDFFSDDPSQIVYGDPQIVNAYDFCMMIQEQTKCTFRAASKAAARVVPELFDGYWSDLVKRRRAEREAREQGQIIGA
jgi:hypothetical protein